MRYFDCFNGDADGICALTQLRLNNPVESTLVTGVKRDINLLSKIVDKVEANDVVTVLDISMDKNKQDLLTILDKGVHVFYCDHHYAGEIPNYPNLVSLVNMAPDVCTSLLINQHLNNGFLPWAVVGTFGDNLAKSAIGLAKKLELSPQHLKTLQNLGVYLNYNGYGAGVDDLFFDPAELYKRTSVHKTPDAFMREDADTYKTLEAGYHTDMQSASKAPLEFQSLSAAVVVLPNETWARRVSGVYGNELANRTPDRAHAVLTDIGKDRYLVSVRAPLNNKTGADDVCRQFETGGGRAAAAGINELPKADLPRFIDVLSSFYAQGELRSRFQTFYPPYIFIGSKQTRFWSELDGSFRGELVEKRNPIKVSEHSQESVAENLLEQLQEWVEDLASVATKIESMATWVLLLGLVCVSLIGVKLYTPEGVLWWNIVKIGVFALPLLIWFVFWRIIRQLADAPQEMAEIANDDDNAISATLLQLRTASFRRPKGVFSLLGSVRDLRKTEGLEVMFDTVSGIALLANPLFALAVILSLLASLGLLLLTPLIWLIFQATLILALVLVPALVRGRCAQASPNPFSLDLSLNQDLAQIQTIKRMTAKDSSILYSLGITQWRLKAPLSQFQAKAEPTAFENDALCGEDRVEGEADLDTVTELESAEAVEPNPAEVVAPNPAEALEPNPAEALNPNPAEALNPNPAEALHPSATDQSDSGSSAFPSEPNWQQLYADFSQRTHCDPSVRVKTLVSPDQPVATVALILPAPSAHDLSLGRLHGESSRLLLKELLRAANIDQNDTYSSNSVKCAGVGLHEEPCSDWIQTELQILAPKICIVFGESAARTFLKTNQTLAPLRSKPQKHPFLPLTCFVSHALEDMLVKPELKQECWSDLKAVKSYLSSER